MPIMNSCENSGGACVAAVVAGAMILQTKEDELPMTGARIVLWGITDQLVAEDHIDNAHAALLAAMAWAAE